MGMEWEKAVKRFRNLFTVSILLVSISASAGTTLFSVPFGDPLPYKPGRCPDRAPIEKVCFISPETSRTSGMGKLPSKGLPPWAEHSSPDIRIGKQNEIKRIDFSTWASKKIQSDVLNSISSRFGKPGHLESGSLVGYEWTGEGIYIKYYCASSGCALSFMSDAYMKEIERDQAALKAKRQAMPTSP